MAHVFISYVRENEQLVDRLCKELRSRGIEVWIDREQIRPGQRWQESIRSAIQHGAYFIACFSHEYLDRDHSYMNEELTLAIDELRKKPVHRTWFIPVLLSDCLPPDRRIGGGETIRDIQWVALNDDWSRGVESIVDVLLSPSRSSEKKKVPLVTVVSVFVSILALIVSFDAFLYKVFAKNPGPMGMVWPTIPHFLAIGIAPLYVGGVLHIFGEANNGRVASYKMAIAAGFKVWWRLLCARLMVQSIVVFISLLMLLGGVILFTGVPAAGIALAALGVAVLPVLLARYTVVDSVCFFEGLGASAARIRSGHLTKRKHFTLTFLWLIATVLVLAVYIFGCSELRGRGVLSPLVAGVVTNVFLSIGFFFSTLLGYSVYRRGRSFEGEGDHSRVQVKISASLRNVRLRRFGSVVFVVAMLFVGSLGVLRSTVVDRNDLIGNGMAPTLGQGANVLVNKVAYDLRFPYTRWRIVEWGGPQRGDVVVFITPGDRKRRVSRIIGLPGEELEFDQDRVAIDGIKAGYVSIPNEIARRLFRYSEEEVDYFEEMFEDVSHPVSFKSWSGYSTEDNTVEVPANEFFLLSDSRDNSIDSRGFGTIHRSDILGQVETIPLPW